MLFEITHHTRYQYTAPVFLEPMTVMLRPRSDASQTVRSHHIVVTPTPSGMTHCTGLDGNCTDTIWFSGLQDHLLITVETQVETHYDDPFHFLITDLDAMTVPVTYAPHLAFVLAPYLACDKNDEVVSAFATEVMDLSNQETIPFLMQLVTEIPNRLAYQMREDGDAWTPAQTLRYGHGSCRDFAMLFVGICRRVGIAARFVSGYCYGDQAADSHMHAWAEAYLPGAGWRGFDPSSGAAIGDNYISVAAAQRPQDAAPTFGNFRGEAVSSMAAEISIRVIEQNPDPS